MSKEKNNGMKKIIDWIIENAHLFSAVSVYDRQEEGKRTRQKERVSSLEKRKRR
ncbi:MAG: hypothetical protein ABI758_02265 [Candidatus Woesebacteria bacterium]